MGIYSVERGVRIYRGKGRVTAQRILILVKELN